MQSRLSPQLENCAYGNKQFKRDAIMAQLIFIMVLGRYPLWTLELKLGYANFRTTTTAVITAALLLKVQPWGVYGPSDIGTFFHLVIVQIITDARSSCSPGYGTRIANTSTQMSTVLLTDDVHLHILIRETKQRERKSAATNS